MAKQAFEEKEKNRQDVGVDHFPTEESERDGALSQQHRLSAW